MKGFRVLPRHYDSEEGKISAPRRVTEQGGSVVARFVQVQPAHPIHLDSSPRGPQHNSVYASLQIDRRPYAIEGGSRPSGAPRGKPEMSKAPLCSDGDHLPM